MIKQLREYFHQRSKERKAREAMLYIVGLRGTRVTAIELLPNGQLRHIPSGCIAPTHVELLAAVRVAEMLEQKSYLPDRATRYGGPR